MLLDAQPYMERSPSLGILPGAAIFLSALSVTMIGQGLEAKRKRKRAAADDQVPGTTPETRSAIVGGEAL